MHPWSCYVAATAAAAPLCLKKDVLVWYVEYIKIMSTVQLAPIIPLLVESWPKFQVTFTFDL